MANYNTLKTDIQSVIRQNDNNEITGQILQQSLLSMVNSLGAGYQFMGVATPATDPGTPDQKVFYLAIERGTYSHFNNIIVSELSVLFYNTQWDSDSLNVPFADYAKLMDSATVERIKTLDLFDESDLSISSISATPQSGFYDYRQEYPTFQSNASFSCYRIDNITNGNMYSFVGQIRYTAAAAIIFLDENGRNIGYIGNTPDGTQKEINTGIVFAPIRAKSIVFTSYTGDGTTPTIKKYTLPQLLNKEAVNDIVVSTLYPDNQYVSEDLIFTDGVFYHYKTGVQGSNAAFTSCVLTDFSVRDKISFVGDVGYSAIAAISFFDENNQNIGYVYGDNTSTIIHADTGLVDIPSRCTKIILGAYIGAGIHPSAKLHKRPKIINEISISDYLPKQLIEYCNPYHYVFGTTVTDDITNSGFNSNFESNTNGSHLIHSKYFKSYRRKHEWRVVLGSNSVIQVGTTNSPSAVNYSSRMSYFKIDVANKTLTILTSEGASHAVVNLPNIIANKTYIVRISQFDYDTQVDIIDYATLELVGTYLKTSAPATSLIGKVIGYPFIQLVSGSVAVKCYDTYLMYRPEVIFIGDSITECGYRQDTYASKFIKNELHNNGCIIAQGGATVDSMALSWNSEIVAMKPKYLSLLGGTNGTITNSQIENWKSRCDENNIIFILNFVPVSKDPTSYPWESKNEIISNAAIIGARFDVATALNNNPDDGANNDLFGDDVHPNANGQIAMYDRFKNDVQII